MLRQQVRLHQRLLEQVARFGGVTLSGIGLKELEGPLAMLLGKRLGFEISLLEKFSHP